MNKVIAYSSADGAVGLIHDVSDKHYYTDPRIELYDELECDCYKLICDFAKVIGVYLDKNKVDYSLANQLRDNVIEMLEEQFKIPFPVYGESAEERAARLACAKESFAELVREHGEDVASLDKQIKNANEQKNDLHKDGEVEITREHPLGGLYL